MAEEGGAAPAEGGGLLAGAAAPAEGTVAPDAPATTEPVVDGGAPWTHQLANTELHGDAALTRYQSLDAFVDGHLALDKSQGSKVSYPGETATQEEWAAFYRGVPGYPETADGYAAGTPEMHESVALSGDEFATVLGRFHSLGMTNSQVEGAMTLLAEMNASRFQAQEAEGQAHIDTAYASLQALQGWGPHTDRNLQVANEAIRREFGDDQGWLNTLVAVGENGAVQPLKNVPQFIQMAYQYGQMKGHGRFVPGGTNAASAGQAKAAIDQAFVDQREGKITAAERDEVISQHGALAYSEDPDGVSFVRGGASSGPPR